MAHYCKLLHPNSTQCSPQHFVSHSLTYMHSILKLKRSSFYWGSWIHVGIKMAAALALYNRDDANLTNSFFLQVLFGQSLGWYLA